RQSGIAALWGYGSLATSPIMRNEMSQALVMVSQSKPKFFAHQIHNAIKGLGVRDKDLIRVLVSRAEIDLATIQMDFERIFNKSLEQNGTGAEGGAKNLFL
ncbi:Annexin, partial [Teladorsagia circumcincta]